MTNQDDVLVIGGGVIGACVAYYLREQGRSVTLVEKDEICAGASHGNVGLIAVGHAIPLAAPGVLTQGLKWLLDRGSPLYIKPRLNLDLVRWLLGFQSACTEEQLQRTIPVLLDLGRRSLALFDELIARENLDCGYQRQGRLFLFTNQSSFQANIEEAFLLRGHGVESVVLDNAGARQMEPSVSSAVVGGIYLPDYANLVPGQFVRELAGVIEERGGRLRTHTEVIGFETTGRRISAVVTTRGTFQADQIVLAAGAWSPIVARDLKLRLPIQPAKGYSLTYKRPSNGPRLPLSLSESKVAVAPMGDMLRCSSTLELAGFDASINEHRLAATRQATREYLSGLENLELIEVWRGFRPLTPDTLPIIGRSPTYENLIVATGHGMLGVTHGPITGRLVSQTMARETPDLDLWPLRVNRFTI